MNRYELFLRSKEDNNNNNDDDKNNFRSNGNLKKIFILRLYIRIKISRLNSEKEWRHNDKGNYFQSLEKNDDDDDDDNKISYG